MDPLRLQASLAIGLSRAVITAVPVIAAVLLKILLQFCAIALR